MPKSYLSIPPGGPITEPNERFGPNDSSDTASERQSRDIAPDRAVDSDEAGLAHTPPDPARNGGHNDG